MSETIYRPQRGAQEKFLSTDADIAIYGGAAGGGKSFALLLDAVRWTSLDEFHGVIFRRQSTELRKSGSLLDESRKMYKDCGGTLRDMEMLWKFGMGVDIKFAGLPHKNDVEDWHGAQLDFIAFDELTTFDEYQFWYLTSRLRSTSGNINPYLRATCNPKPNWVLNLIEWWIDKDGFPIKERSGVLRWYIRTNDVMHWFDTKLEADRFVHQAELPKTTMPKSFTFIPSTVEDNPALIAKNPHYISTLEALKDVEKQQLLYGNWRIQPSGTIFKIEQFKYFIVPPHQCEKILVIDTAQETSTANDYTVMQVWGKSDGLIYKLYNFRARVEFNEQVSTLISIAYNHAVRSIYIEKKANGSALIQSARREMASSNMLIPIKPIERNKDKYTRGYECQGYLESGYVCINKFHDDHTDFISEVAQFSPEDKNKSGVHDDQVDCLMDAIDILLIKPQKHASIQNSSNANRSLKLNQKKKSFSGY